MHLIIFLSSHYIHCFFFVFKKLDGEARAKNRANKNGRGLGRAALPNPPHFIARPTFGFRPRFIM